MKEKIIRVGVLDIALLVLSVIFLLGMLLFFGPCGPGENGTWMTCHWAGRAVTGCAAALVVIELLHTLLSGSGIRQGLDLATVTLAALAALLPGRLIDLCMMDTMRCRTVMAPVVRIFAALIAVIAAVDFIFQVGRGISREVHRRNELRRQMEDAEDAEEEEEVPEEEDEPGDEAP